jgi:hypothetical protein
MTESQLITLGWCYELAKADRAQALRAQFNDALKGLQSPDLRQHYIYCFNQGREEARRK